MEFFVLLDNFFYLNFTIFILGTYILNSLCFNVFFNSANSLGLPTLLNSTTNFTIYVCSCAFIFLIFSLTNIINELMDNSFVFNQTILVIFFFSSVLTLIIAREFFSSRLINKYEYDILFVFAIFSSTCLCFSNDFLLIYLGIELQSLCLYIMATFQRNSEFSVESGLKYFVLGSIISCNLLLGFILIYISSGTTNFEFLNTLGLSTPLILSGLVLVISAFMFKIGATPFHFWLCDVYEGSLITTTLFFSTIPKIILFGIIIKLTQKLSIDFISFLIFLSAIFSIIVGSIAGLYQKRIKRLLAYSTISHTGFILIGVISITPETIKSSFIYIIIYLILTLSVFCIIFNTITSINFFPKYISHWTSSGLKNNTLIITFSLILLSMAGIPPLAGFFSKFFVLFSLITKKYIISAIVIVVFSGIACFYYIRLIKTFFFNKTKKNYFWISTKQSGINLALTFTFFFNIYIFLKPNILSSFSSIVSLCLF